MDNEIMVSIICNTYNHEKYIRKCIDGFLIQKTNFKYEILIHDDASTDNTAQIIHEYEINYPNLIKPIYQKENKYSKNINISQQFQFPRVLGKYVAFCEGDDYWISDNKLQRQVDALEKYEEVDICVHGAIVVENDVIISKIEPSKQNCIFSTNDVILGGGAFVATNSIMIRRELIENIPEFRRFMQIDYTLQIQGSLRGGMLYLDGCLSAYNYMTPESWTRKISLSKKKMLDFNVKFIKMLDLLDNDTNNIYHKDIEYKKIESEFNLLSNVGPFHKLLDNRFRIVKKNLSLKRKIITIIKQLFPFIFFIRCIFKYKEC